MKKPLLSLLVVIASLCSCLSLGAQTRKASPIAFLQRFYTEYIRSIDRMLEYDQRDSIIATALTPEMHEYGVYVGGSDEPMCLLMHFGG